MIQDFTKPTIITGQQYGTKVSVEINHSDTDIDELFDAFKTICVGLGYHESTWKQWVLDRADEYKQDDFEERYSFDSPILKSESDKETFFNAITNPPYPTPKAIKGVQDFLDSLDGLSEKQIDEALAEHNEDEWNDEMETQFWNEQPPEPFATPEEVEKYNIDGQFDDYGKRVAKESKKIGRRGIKKK